MNTRIKLLEIILSPDYKGLTVRELAKLIYDLPIIQIKERTFIKNTVSQLSRRGFLKRSGFIVLPTETTKAYYDFLISYKITK